MSDTALISTERIRSLAEDHGDHRITITMPTHRAGRETRQDPIRLKNRLDEAEELLARQGLSQPEVDQMLVPSAALLGEQPFWQHQSEGLAVFLSPERFETYRVPINLPEQTMVSHRFRLKSLFPLLTGDGRFFVLVVSQKQVRLLECSRDLVARVEVENMPEGRRDLMEHIDEEKSVQFHSRAQQFTSGGAQGMRAAVFHGQGAGEDDVKARIFEYFRMIDDALHPVLHDQRAPLVFAGVDYLFPIFREANSYHALHDEPLTGNFDHLDDREIHARAWEVIRPHFEHDRRKLLDEFHAAEGTGLASAVLDDVLPNAFDGRVKAIFVPSGEAIWGRFDRSDRTVELHDDEQPGDEDLLDAAAIFTFINRGRVYTVNPDEMPGAGRVAAVYRY